MHVFLRSREQKNCCCTCLWLSLESSCLNRLSDCSNLQIEHRTNQVCFIRHRVRGSVYCIVIDGGVFYGEYRVVLYTACLFPETIVNCNRLLVQPLSIAYTCVCVLMSTIHSTRAAGQSGDRLMCVLLKLQVSLLSSSPLIYTHIHISIGIDWTWKCSLCCISELRRLPSLHPVVQWSWREK